ncbi:MAG: hypothetical protein ACPG9N_00030 [Miltoncostaeaceae bacterium]
MEAGDTVRWWTKHGGWRFGRLSSITGQTARVQLGDAVRRVPLSDLKPWPPEATDTTSQGRGVRRKG